MLARCVSAVHVMVVVMVVVTVDATLVAAVSTNRPKLKLCTLWPERGAITVYTGSATILGIITTLPVPIVGWRAVWL